MLERFRTVLRRVLGASTPLIGGRVVSAVLTFALPLVLARMLTPEIFGTYKQFFLIASTVQLTGQLGLTQSLYYFLPRGGDRRGAYLGQTISSLAILGFLFGAILWLSMPLVGRWVGDGALVGVRTPLSLFVAFMLSAAPLEGALMSEGRVGGAALAYVLTDGVRAASLVIGAHYWGASGLFWAAAATSAARVAAVLILGLVRVLPFDRPRVDLFREQLAYALPFAGASYLYVAQRYFSQYAVSASFNAATFALFAVASFHLPVVDIIFGPMSEVMMVRIGNAEHKHDKRAVRASWNDTVLKLASILFPATACAWLFGPTVLPILFTHKYDASVPLFMLATFEIPLWILPLDALLRSAGQTRFLFLFNCARLVVTSALVVGGLKLFGLQGAIAGGIASEALARFGMLFRASKFLQAPMARVCDWSPLVRTAAAAALAALPAYGVRLLSADRMSAVVTGALAYSVTYVAAMIALRRREPISVVAAALDPSS